MKKIFSNSVIALILAIGFSGCLGDDISCDEQTTQDLVIEITQSSIIDNIFLAKYKNGDYVEGDIYSDMIIQGSLSQGTFKEMANLYGFNKLKNDDKEKPKLAIIYDQYIDFEKNFDLSGITMESFITTAKNKELSKVECSATINVEYENNTYSFNTDYTSQLTDDKKEVYVQVESFSNN